MLCPAILQVFILYSNLPDHSTVSITLYEPLFVSMYLHASLPGGAPRVSTLNLSYDIGLALASTVYPQNIRHTQKIFDILAYPQNIP